ncbi:MAG: 50S ribosomal protein L5 [bacterium]|jgi:large subunit ribosomal protein L5
MALPKNRLKEAYDQTMRSELQRELDLPNIMMVPRVEKIVLNIGVGEGYQNPKALESAVKTLSAISGQKPVVTRARKSISNFKIREGHPIGASCTLRGQKMWHFLDKLLNMVLPRVRDFQGISVKRFDGRGNLSIGFKDQLVFPEIVFDQVEFLKGVSVTIVTSAPDDYQASCLLKKLGMPFHDFKVVERVS